MWNQPSKKRLAKLPKLYETEHIPLKEKLVQLHFFIGGCDWFVCEFDQDRFFGFCILNNDYQMAEWGYVSFSELKSIKVDGWLEVDCELEEFWQPKRAIEIEKIREAQGWLKENKPEQTKSKKDELILKTKRGHFTAFKDLFAEVTSPNSDFYGIDPYPIWEVANEKRTG